MLPYVGVALGADPALSMVCQAAACVPEARFFAARMESLPLNDGCCRLITAAGSLNYTDIPAALREAARVLSPGGLLIVYDFAPGRRFAGDKSLEKWFDAFLGRYPKPADGAAALDPPALRALAGGLFQPVAESTIEEREIYDASRYANYMMTETNAAAAVCGGESPAAIRQWMDETLPAVFGERTREVLFDAYFAVLAKPSSSSTRVAP
jgi:SAM-dependent methyltransferase